MIQPRWTHLAAELAPRGQTPTTYVVGSPLPRLTSWARHSHDLRRGLVNGARCRSRFFHHNHAIRFNTLDHVRGLVAGEGYFDVDRPIRAQAEVGDGGAAGAVAGVDADFAVAEEPLA